ncbi:MAG: hypothetical protein HY901_14800, partial [Deltaproteobacteria bacterium]|nr:hypothetical protein [Deltaproteobacteria bacterium]
ALAAQDAFAARGLPAFLERSGGGKGWHLWCFFETPILAAAAQSLGRALAPRNVPLANGGVADARAIKGIEVFPKQPKIRQDGLGNLLWLPWWHGAPEGSNQFFQRGADGKLEPFVPEDFQTAKAAAVEEALKALAPPPPAVKPQKPRPQQRPAGSSDPAWATWRTDALAALPLEAVYGSWLTGKQAGSGWLECRDPSSATGDQNPSASVAEGTGEAERGAFHSFITSRTISVFDFLVEHGGIPDFRSACDKVAALSGVSLPAAKAEPPKPGSSGGGSDARPEIQTNNRQLRDVISDAWKAVKGANKRPTLFLRSGTLARLARADDGLRIETMDEPATYGYLARIADWMKVTEDAVTNVSPVRDVARDMLAYPHSGLPALEAVVAAPVFDREGALVMARGYHAGARLWYEPEGFTVAPVPERPSEADVVAARTLLLDDLLVDFPFAADSDRAHALGALILPFVRRMVAGCTPIHLVEAPTPGSGKGLLGDLVSLISIGRVCEPTTFTADEDEARKKITSILLKAQPVILLDNIRNGLDSAQLASALTAETWSDRILGQTRMIDLPNRATWIVTANNPHLSLEIARRCVRIRLDAKTDRPWARSGFKHSPLRDWARANRSNLVHALLTLIRAWIAAGRPSGRRSLGSFESWAGVVGGLLDVAGVQGFLGNTEQLYEAADAEGQEWREFVTAWWDKHGEVWVSATDLLTLAVERDLLGAAIGDKSSRSQKIRLGKALSAARDRRFGEWCVVIGRNTDGNAAKYRLVKGGDANGDPIEALGPAQRQLELRA